MRLVVGLSLSVSLFVSAFIAFHVAPRTLIKKAITSFDGLNAVIKRLLQGWIAARGKAICDSNNVANPRTGSLRHAVALIAHQQTDYSMAKEQFRLAVAVRSEVLGESDSATLESMHRLANTLIKDPGGQTEAMVLFRRIHATESASETTRLRAQKMTAQILMDSGDSAGAEVERVDEWWWPRAAAALAARRLAAV